MQKTIKTRGGRAIALPTAKENAGITAAIAADGDTYELDDQEFVQLRRPGRPLGSGTKTQITLRLDTEVIEKFKASGDGWQTRINEALKSWVRSHA